jgi:GT2 family glycosyltransferase
MSDPEVDMIGPMLLFPDKTNQSYFNPKSYLTLWKLFCEQLYLFRLFPRIRIFNSYYRTYMDYNREAYVEQISGAALMFKKYILSRTGLMDDNYFMYHEESDFCYQAVKNGFRLLYYPQSKIIHVGGFTNDSKWHRKAIFTSLKYYFKKNFGALSCLLAITIYKAGETLRIAIKSLQK